MKKNALIILSSLVAALMLSLVVVPVFAAQTVKVYYTEDIGGGGDKVYHVTYCEKAPSYGPLKCLAKDKTTSWFPAYTQCIDSKTNEAKDGAYIKGCYVYKAGDSGEYEYEPISGAAEGASSLVKFPKVDAVDKITKKKDEGGCSDEPGEQGFKYAPEYGVFNILPAPVVGEGSEAAVSALLLGTFSWPDSSVGPDEYVTAKFGDDPDTGFEKIYRSVLCATYDMVFKRQPNGTISTTSSRESVADMPVGTTTARIRSLVDSGPAPSSDEACNTNNANKAVSGGGVTVEPSTMFDQNPTYSCSIAYRITGGSGSEILANYIGALYKWAASLVGIIAVLIMVFSGVQISMAGADTAKLDSAKNRIMQSIIGLVILFLSGLILYTINPTFFTG